MAQVDVLGEILQWSEGLCAWQRDALRRLVAQGDLEPSDIEELAALCKSAHGLAEAIVAEPLSREHVPRRGPDGNAVTVESLQHHRGVNALAPEQTLTFGPGLTIVYGPNAGGKSGYTRILKKACRARGAEQILGNVFDQHAGRRPSATIRFKVGTESREHHWEDQDEPEEHLGQVSVFDTHCATVYLKEETDVAFRPFGLDLFDSLSAACEDVRKILEKERNELNQQQPVLPKVAEGTEVHKALSHLTSLTKEAGIRALGQLSCEERDELGQARKRLQDLDAQDPKKTAGTLTLRAGRLERLAKQLDHFANITGDETVRRLLEAKDSLRRSVEAAQSLHKQTFPPTLLPGTGGEAWKDLWDTASKFSALDAYPGRPFPVTHEARCVLCQQELDDSAQNRMEQFRDFLASNARQEADTARRTFQERLQALKDCEPATDQTDNQLAELRLEREDLADTAEALLRASTTRRDAALEAIEGDVPLPALPAIKSIGDEIHAEAANLHERSKDLLKDNTPGKRAALRSRIAELESQEALGDGMDAVVAEIQRKRELAAYTEALKETNTKAITLKSSDVTRRAVTGRLASAFQEELAKVGFKQLQVTLEPHKGMRGALYHKLTLRHAPSAELSRIASEGESRALALAAFFAELSTAADRSAILFDDPVSSLDHTWRENVARRLAEDACERQVIVFTHDIVFVLALERAAESRGANCAHQYIRWEATGAGVSTPELPWVAMRVKERLGVLNKRWQEAEKLHRTASRETYERAAIEIYGLLREAWERAVEEVLLDGVVERYRQSVETRRTRKLADIEDTDCDALDAGMTKCSRWLRGHDQPPAENISVPEPDEVRRDVDALNDWVTTIRKRRN